MNVNRVKYLLFRLCLLVALLWFVSLDRNPIVVLQSRLGLSPSPLERLFGIKGPFSGMTEGIHRLAHGDLSGAISANVVTPFFAAITVMCVLIGYRPQVRTRRQEALFFLAVILLSVLVNVAAPFGVAHDQANNAVKGGAPQAARPLP
jgi:hypothetical protein